MDLVVEGRTLGPEGSRPVRLGIEDGRFVEPGGRRADVVYEDGYLLPAAIDVHVHFREPGHTHKEDITSGTTSAAFGGVALAVDMPNTEPATLTVEAYEQKAALVEERAVIDVGLWAGLGPGLESTALGDRATGYKLYAGPTTGHLLLEDPDQWREAVRAVAPSGRPLAVHAEHPAVLDQARAAETAPEEPASHARSRPGDAEVQALELIAAEATRCNAHLHACHLSDPRSVGLVREAGATSEITPHHLLLDQRDVDRLGAFAKVNPPVRDTAARDALWQAFATGRIGCVASDHAPHTREEKERGFDAAPSGLPGVETLFPLLLAKALKGEVPVERVVDACCSNPAKLLGVPAGRFDTGAWASFVHVPAEARPIEADALHAKCGWSPFEGHEAVFPDDVFVRGRWVVREGELVGKPGEGNFVGGPGWA